MQTFKILIVEDDAQMAMTFERAIEGFARSKGISATVLKADNTDDAYELFVENPDFDAVLLDGSPTGHGFSDTYKLALAIRLRSNKCRLVATSGSPADCMDLWDFCDKREAKPFNGEALLRKLGLLPPI
ncbi:MAG: hypothetical protein PHC70_03120 [Patescibacteria group bacterium]|nr:hypothetical protein [Patescibacteria group bacterium]